MPTIGRSTTQRGYGTQHQKLRAQWAPVVATGTVHCHATRCVNPHGRTIRPGTAWDLGHTPDRTTYTGPEHARCNRREGAARGNKQRNTHKHPMRTAGTVTGQPRRHSRDW